MKVTNKFFRVAEVIYLAICDIILGVFGWLFLSFILFACKLDTLYHALLSYGGYFYILAAFILIIRNIYHRVKWYVRANPVQMQCLRCHTIIPLTRYNEDHYLKSPISFCFPRINQLFRFAGYRVIFYKTAYRPYLQLDCPKCSEKHVICPYCHEPIPQNQVECKYDKPSVCPHCGKKIYTPVPMREWEKGFYVGDILN